MEIPRDRAINVKRPNADYLIQIRKGQHDLESILEKCEQDLKLMEDVYDKCDLSDIIDTTTVKSIAVRVREKFEKQSKRQDVY
jgi:hypothetical protein